MQGSSPPREPRPRYTPGMQMRPARPGEGRKLTDMLVEWQPSMASSYFRRIEDVDGWFVVESDGKILGFLEAGQFCRWEELAGYEHFSKDDFAPFIRWIFVLPEHRSTGAGSALLSGWISSLENSSVPLVVVMPDKSSDDEARIRFFGRHGFHWLTTNKDWLQPWLMGRPLPSH